MTLKALNIEYLRGAVLPFCLPFEKGKKLTVIYGENGTGKSTICDALEFWSHGKVSSLENRGLGTTQRFWPSLGKQPADIAVTLEMSDGSCRVSFSTSGDVLATPPDRRSRVEVFRKSQILSLIEAKPGERYAAISRFIDVSAVETSEASLRDLIRGLKDSQKAAIAALAENEKAIHQFWETAGKPGDGAFAWAESECKQTIGTSEAEGAALHTLQMAYSRLVGIPERLRAAQQTLKDAEKAASDAAKTFEEAVTASTKDAAEIVTLLQSAQAYLHKKPASPLCPLCESAENARGLDQRIRERLAAFSDVQKAQSRSSETNANLQRAKQQLEIAQKEAREHVARFEETVDGFVWPPGIPLAARPVPATAAGLTAWLKDSLAFPEKWKQAERDRFDRKQFVETLKQALNTWKENRQEQNELSSLIPRLDQALTIAMDERRNFTDEILSKISAEVARLYEAVHPGEGLNKISLELDAKKRASLEIGAMFCGKSTRPQAYFSDSHLDTLGLCVFLALAAIDEPGETILVLDDVLASVDEPHVERLIEMLYAEATKFRHCILTTHYRPWREKYRWGWLRHGQCHFLELQHGSPASGLVLTRSVPDIERLRDLLNAQSPDLQSICSKAGVILEAALDFLTLQYECHVPRRAGGRYTLGDLLPALDKKLRQTLRVDVLAGGNDAGKPAYKTVTLENHLDELNRISQTRNVFGCHFNDLSFELLDADALTFGRQVVALMEVLTDDEAGWPRNGKSGEYWATAGETRRLYPYRKPS